MQNDGIDVTAITCKFFFNCKIIFNFNKHEMNVSIIIIGKNLIADLAQNKNFYWTISFVEV
jgi:hypothetical protein